MGRPARGARRPRAPRCGEAGAEAGRDQACGAEARDGECERCEPGRAERRKSETSARRRACGRFPGDRAGGAQRRPAGSPGWHARAKAGPRRDRSRCADVRPKRPTQASRRSEAGPCQRRVDSHHRCPTGGSRRAASRAEARGLLASRTRRAPGGRDASRQCGSSHLRPTCAGTGSQADRSAQTGGGARPRARFRAPSPACARIQSRSGLQARARAAPTHARLRAGPGCRDARTCIGGLRLCSPRAHAAAAATSAAARAGGADGSGRLAAPGRRFDRRPRPRSRSARCAGRGERNGRCAAGAIHSRSCRGRLARSCRTFGGARRHGRSVR